jgi:acyl-CoA thioesterase
MDAVPASVPTTMPLAELLGIRLLREDADVVVCGMQVRPEHLNQGLMTHGGALFSLADTALGVLANPTSSEGWVGTTFTLQLFRAPRVGDVLEARAFVEHRSRNVQFCRAELIRPADGVLLGVLSTQLQRAVPRPELPVPAGDVELRVVDAIDPLVVAMLAARRREQPGPDIGPDSTVTVAFVDRQPRGFVVVLKGSGVSDAWVHPRWRGTGLGRALLRGGARRG